MSVHTVLDSSLVTAQAQTRAERRRIKKEAEKALYKAEKAQVTRVTVTQDKIDQLKREMYKDFVENERKYIDDVIFNCFVIALNKELGIGKTRLTKVLDEVKEQLDCLKLGYLSLNDLKQLSESLQGTADKIR